MPKRNELEIILQRLATRCEANTVFTLLRVLDQTPEFLRYLTDGGLIPGCTATVVQNLPSAGIMTLQAGDHQISLSRDAARQLLVRIVS